MVNIYIKVLKHGKIPVKMTEGSSGYDVFLPYHVVEEPIFIKDKFKEYTGQLSAGFLIPLGFKLEIPVGYEAQLRMRSSVAKRGITILNAPATIDSDYRGEIKLLIDIPYATYVVAGERIAQLVFQKVPEIKLLQVDELSDTIRGSGGFGSTNV